MKSNKNILSRILPVIYPDFYELIQRWIMCIKYFNKLGVGLIEADRHLFKHTFDRINPLV